MKHLKEAIEKAISDSGIKSALDQETALGLWNIIVGSVISEVTKVEKVDSGTMFIRVDSSVWRQELHMQKEELVNKINNKVGTKAIRDIRFI